LRFFFFFDETIIGDSISLPLVVGELRKSGGENINVIRTSEKVVYISEVEKTEKKVKKS